MANKPNNPALWSRAKSLAKQKFDVYPSAYANGWAAKWYKGKGGSWRKAEYGMEVMGDGGTNNAGFRALPPEVQQKIMENMAEGGEKMPPEIARARFAAAGNLDQMGSYGYGYGGYIPEMMYGGREYMQQGGEQDQIMQLIQMYAQMNQIDPEQLMQQLQQMPPEEQQQAIQQMAQTLEQGAGQQQPDMQQAAMRYGGYMTGMFAEGGEPNGGMALGQISAVADKMNKLRQFVSPEQNLDPWIASKLAVIDDSTASISDYMMYNPEAQGGGEEMEMYEQEEMMEQMANGGYTVTRSSDRKGKTHKVTGPDGTVKYFGDSNLGQHPKDPERKKAFYARHKTNLANNPFFRAFARKTWKEGGSTFSGNAFYQGGGEKEPQIEDYPDYGSYRADLYRFNAGQMGDQALPQSLMPEQGMQEESKVMWHPEWKEQGIDPEADYAASMAASVANGVVPVSSSPAPVVAAQQAAASKPARTIDYSGVSVVDLLKSAGKASDYNSRKELAAKLGIDNYYGSAKQNLEMIKKVTSNAAVLDDYQSAMPSRSGSTRRSSVNSNGTITTTTKNADGSTTVKQELDPIAENIRKLEEANPSAAFFAQAKQAYLAANPGMTSADYDEMQSKSISNRPTISASNKSFFETSSGEYDDSYMLNKIANDPHSPGNVRKQKQKDFAMNMGTALLAALIPSIGYTRYYPMLRGLPAASKLVKALPQGAKALPKPVPTNWVTNSGKAFGMGGGYAPAMRKKANFAMGGPVEGEVMDVSPEELEMLRQQGYQFEIM
jgi:hypothetical protein